MACPEAFGGVDLNTSCHRSATARLANADTSQAPTDHALFLSQKRFGSLDGLRAICIVTIIWQHTAPAWVNPTLAHIGSQGVTLFFAISGFLITTLLLRERARNADIDIKSFYVRRALRIFPLYYGVLALYVAVVTVMERHTAAGRAFFDNLIYFATCTSNLFVPLDGRVIFYFAWSVAAEEQFYLLWPSVLYWSRTEWRASIVLCLSASCVSPANGWVSGISALFPWQPSPGPCLRSPCIPGMVFPCCG